MNKPVKLKKNFRSETDTIKAFVSCSCPYIQCACRDIYNPYSVNSASQDGLKASTQNYSTYLSK